jgi:hypothetical protein
LPEHFKGWQKRTVIKGREKQFLKVGGGRGTLHKGPLTLLINSRLGRKIMIEKRFYNGLQLYTNKVN